MRDRSWDSGPVDHHDGTGCAYILDRGDDPRCCSAARQPGSSYCHAHHVLCHVASGTSAEALRLREVEALAEAVGGRRARAGGGPSPQFLKRLEHAVRVFS